MFDLQQYQQEKQKIKNDDRYKEKGKVELLAKLERRYKEEARKDVRKLTSKAQQAALKLRDAQEKRFEEIEKAQSNIDWGRLNYEVESMKSKIAAARGVSDIVSLWDNVKKSNNPYAIQAWKDTSQGIITEKYGTDSYTNLKGQLFEDINQTKADIVRVEVSKDELEARNELMEIEAQVNDINDIYGSGQSVIRRVFDEISFDNGKIKLGFDYEVNKLTDRKETPREVAYRLERERDKAVSEYQKILKEKGFDGEIDGDFDDLSPVI